MTLWFRLCAALGPFGLDSRDCATLDRLERSNGLDADGCPALAGLLYRSVEEPDDRFIQRLMQ